MSTRKQHSLLVPDTSSFAEDESTSPLIITTSSLTPFSQPSKKRRAEGSLADHAQTQPQSHGPWSMDRLKYSLSSPTMTQAPTATNRLKDAQEEQRLKRAIEEAERQMLGLGQSDRLGLDSRKSETRDEATEQNMAEQERRDGNVGGDKGARRRRRSSFLEWEEPVLR